MALGWLLLLHSLADLAAAVYRCAAINPPLTDLLAGTLMRAQFGLLCVWLLAGKDPLSWRLAGFFGGSGWLFFVYSRLLFAGYHKPSIGPAWFRSDFDVYFSSTGPGDLLLKAPLMLALIGVALMTFRAVVWIRSRLPTKNDNTASTQSENSGAKLRWLQFSVADYLIWSFTLGLLMMVYTVTPWHEGWLELVRWRWSLGLQGRLPDSVLMLASAAPTAAMVLLGCWLGQGTNHYLRRSLIAGVIGLICGLGVEIWWHAYHQGPLNFSSPTGTTRMSEVLLQPLVALVVAASCWLVALYDLPAVAPQPVLLPPELAGENLTTNSSH